MKNDSSTDKTQLNIQELIVVEGKNDANAIRRALGKTDVIWTEGFGLTEKKLNLIAEMAKRQGVIVCTDPDYAGQQIRERIKSRVPEARHVFLSKTDALNKKGDDIGLENVSSEEIRKAFSKVLSDESSGGSKNVNLGGEEITMQDLVENGLVGQPGSAAKRAELGKVLGIGDTNAKQFLFRVNRFAISKKGFLAALESINRGVE